MAPIPSLLLVSAVHHHLVRTKERLRVALVVETGDAREVHHVALLLGYGAAAVNPYLAFETIEDLIGQGAITGHRAAVAIRNYVQALVKGVLKIMSKMGISTVGAYTAAQVFESFGLAKDSARRVLHRHRVQARRGRAGRARRGGGHRATAAPTRTTPPTGCTAAWTSAASTPTAARASCTCSPRKRCSCCSTPRKTAQRRGVPRVRRGGRAAQPRGRCAARHVRLPDRGTAAGPAGRGRADRVDLPPVQHRCHVLRLDLARRRTRRWPSR